jgi:isoquinoline 1-oxidoreductase beta subunit
MSGPLLHRREFLRLSALAGGGLLAACGFEGSSDAVVTDEAEPTAPPASGAAWQPNAFVRIHPDNRVVIVVGAAEIGQGAMTALPMILAEELDADFSQIRVEQSPTDRAYANPRLFMQLTAQSATVMGHYTAQRRAGAATREVLVRAAARRWNVDESQLRTEAGVVHDDGAGRSASYGELATEAEAQRVPTNPVLKAAAQFRLIGQSPRRLDAAAKVDGSTVFGSDLRIPGMLTALIARPPALNGRLRPQQQPAPSYDRAAALAVPGVVDIIELSAGIAVVAHDFWAAKCGRDALAAQWPAPKRSARTMRSRISRMRQWNR